MALDVTREEGICECILDHIVGLGELTVCRWTGKCIRQLNHILRCDLKVIEITNVKYFVRKPSLCVSVVASKDYCCLIDTVYQLHPFQN